MPTREEVLAIARLAGLTLTPEEIQRMHLDLRGILEHTSVLRQLEPPAGGGSDSPLPFDTGASGSAPLRPDVPGADLLSTPPSAIAPVWRDGFFTLPRMRAGDEHG